MAALEFGNPGGRYFSIIVIAVALLMLYAEFVTSRLLRRLGDNPLVRNLLVNYSRSRHILKRIGLTLAISLLVFGLCMPRVGQGVRILKREGCDVCIALDLSMSMLAEDIKPNRIEAAKEAIGRLISLLPDDRFALVGFAGDAFIHCPLTPDHDAISMFLDFLEPGVMAEQGTDIGRAITVCLDALASGTGGGKAIVLFSDGEDHAKTIQDALRIAASQDVKILTVGVGSEVGEPIPVRDREGRIATYKRDSEDKVVISRLDKGLLTKIAESTGGEAFMMRGAGGTVDRIARSLSKIEDALLEQRTFLRYSELFQIPLGICLAILVLEVLVPDGRKRTLV
ncbi:MAG: VWA domain-containing protein [bacterium]